MDPLLKEAACSGDVEFLVKAIDEGKPEDYFSSTWTASEETEGDPSGNIFHLAALNKQTDFVKEAIQRLPTQTVLSLLLHRDVSRHNYGPLHVAAEEGCLDIVKEILGFFKPSSVDYRPWLEWTERGNPLEVAVRAGHEDCALEILSKNKEYFCVWDEDLVKMLKEAVEKGWKRFPVELLNSCPSGTLDIECNNDVVQILSNPNCKLNVCELLFEKLTSYMDGPHYIAPLNIWIRDNEFILLDRLMVMISWSPAVRVSLEKMMSSVDKDGQNPLHIALSKNNRWLILVCQVCNGMNMDSLQSSPLRMKDRQGNTPLHLALYELNEYLVLQFLSLDPQSYQIRNADGESTLFLAVQSGFEEVTQHILATQYPHYNALCRVDGQTVFHVLSNSTEETGRLLAEKCWWLINVEDKNGKTALDIARELNTTWLIDLLNDPPPSQTQFDWVTPFDEDDLSILSFYKNCQDLQEICLAKMDTPLHYMKLRTYKNYQNFLNIPSIAELKNFRDSNGATPLLKAIQRKDVHMAKLLLIDNKVDRSVKDKDGSTTMNLLSNLWKEDEKWKKMCKQIGVNPHLKAAYIREKTNLEEMRSTLSVVAGLLATITFAAGFTLPGGVNSETGHAVLGKDAVFLVFLVADGYAMCTSILVLFCLIWSMVCNDTYNSWIMIDRSVFILMNSLCSTLVAFMTGIFSVVAQKSLWAATLIIVMCSLLGVAAHKTFLDKIVVNLWSFIIFKSTTEQNSHVNETILVVHQGGGEDIADTPQGDTTGTPQGDVASTSQGGGEDIACTSQGGGEDIASTPQGGGENIAVTPQGDITDTPQGDIADTSQGGGKDIENPQGGDEDIACTPQGGGEEIACTPQGGGKDIAGRPQGGGKDITCTPQGGGEDIASTLQGDIAGIPERDIAGTPQGGGEDIAGTPQGEGEEITCTPQRGEEDIAGIPQGGGEDIACTPQGVGKDIAGTSQGGGEDIAGILANRTFLDKIVSKLKFSIQRCHDDSTRPRTLIRKIAAIFKSTTKQNGLGNETRSLILQGEGEYIAGTPQVAENLA